MEKRLYKIGQGKMVDGVCGGIAQYFGLDPTLVRLAWVVFTAMGASGIIAYIACALIIPGSRARFECTVYEILL